MTFSNLFAEIGKLQKWE